MRTLGRWATAASFILALAAAAGLTAAAIDHDTAGTALACVTLRPG